MPRPPQIDGCPYAMMALPLPPSVNNYWKRKRGQGSYYLTEKAKVFRRLVWIQWQMAKAESPIITPDDRLQVTLTIFPPLDKRKHDIDNRVKSTLDALEHVHVFPNDEQVDCIVLHRGRRVDEGAALVWVQVLDQEPNGLAARTERGMFERLAKLTGV